MKINERWAITGNRSDFVLTESSVRKDPKGGEDRVSTKQTYHPSIEQCLHKIVRTEMRNYVCEEMAKNVTDLKVYLDKLNNDIKESARAIEAAVQADRQSPDAAD